MTYNPRNYEAQLEYAEDYIFYTLRDQFTQELQGQPIVEMTVLAHGAGTQTSALLLLAANHNHFRPGQPGHLPIDLALYAEVGDNGTPAEWPDTYDYMLRLNLYIGTAGIPLLQINPQFWNRSLQYDDTGLYDRYLTRETMPLRQYRSCTDHFKVRPQLAALKVIREKAKQMTGTDLRFRQIIGYSADEQHRANRFQPGHDWITPYFPLIDWNWNRQDTLDNLTKLLPNVVDNIGLPKRSGCWFCPFQKRGRINPDTLKPTPRSWIALRQQHPKLYQQAILMEQTQNTRRLNEGKTPIYLYNDKPLQHWTDPTKTAVTMALPFDTEEQPGDDQCTIGCWL